MINSFTHYLKTTIEFGNGKRFEIKNLIEEKNAKKVLLVCDPTVYKLGIANDIIASVEEAGASAVAFTEVEPDPRVERLISAELFARRKNATLLSLRAAEALWI